MKYQSLILSGEDALKTSSTGLAINSVVNDFEKGEILSAAVGVADLLGEVGEALGAKSPKWNAFFDAPGIARDVEDARIEFIEEDTISSDKLAK